MRPAAACYSCAFIALLFGTAIVPVACASAESRPALEIHLEGTDFLEGQSTYLIACLYNRGTSTISDVVPISLRGGCLKIDLVRRGTGESLQRRIPAGAPTAGSGVTLAPDGVLCAIGDLNIVFGSVSGDTASLSSRLLTPSLPRGDYL